MSRGLVLLCNLLLLQTHYSNSITSMATIQHLPSELLRIIFDHYYATVAPKGLHRGHFDRGTEDLQLFPWNVARVCQLWQQIIEHYPYFWTQVVFDLASPDSLRLDAFSRSKNLFFQAVIFDSRTQNESESFKNTTPITRLHKLALIECNQVESITEALLPHLVRCLCLEYNVRFETSLPSFQKLLPNLRINTHCLVLRSDIPFVLEHPHVTLNMIAPSTPFSSLYNLCLRVVEFISVGRIGPQFWASCNFKSLSLELYHYDFCATSSSVLPNTASTYEFFSYLSSMDVNSITLRDLSVCEHHNHVHPQSIVQSHVDVWYWEDMDGLKFENLTIQFWILSSKSVRWRPIRENLEIAFFQTTLQMRYSLLNCHSTTYPSTQESSTPLGSSKANVSSFGIANFSMMRSFEFLLKRAVGPWRASCFLSTIARDIQSKG